MKKILFLLAMIIFLVSDVKAFSIDVDKIELDSKSSKLINNLDKTYKIDVDNFNNEIIYDKDTQNLVKEVVSISFSDSDLETKKKELVNYMYLSNSDGFETLSGSLFIDIYLKKLESYQVSIEYIKDIKTVLFKETDRMAFVYIDDAIVDGENKDIVLAYWLKSNDGSDFRLYYPWITIDDDLESYFYERTIKEDSGEIIGGTYNSLSLTGDSVEVDDLLLQDLYQNNKDSVVQITGMNSNGSNTYGSGFYLKEGIIVTTWSLFLQFLTDSNYIFVNDVYGNTYEVLGVVAAQVDYDVVILKINQETGKKVTLGDSELLNSGDMLFTINSQNNGTFSINYGNSLTNLNGRLENMFALSSGDVGSALFNDKGEVIGFNVGDQLYSELSYANSTNYLRELQTILDNISYDNIRYTILETFKQIYYLDIVDEVVSNNVDSKVWDKFKVLGDIENNITLDLVKASYVDDILSLRFKNNTNGMIDSMYLVSNYIDALLDEGFNLKYQDSNKSIYINKEYKVIIKNNLNYLIIIIMEI